MNPAIYFLSAANVSKTYVPTPVQIGEQIWDQKNLDTAYYRDGTLITAPTGATGDTFFSKTSGAWMYYNYDSTYREYGRLYNHNAIIGYDGTATTRNLAPEGWEVASASDWDTLITTAGGTAVAGKPLREIGLTHWATSNTGTDAFSFKAFGGGAYQGGSVSTAVSANIGTYGYWRTKTSTDIRRIQGGTAQSVSAPGTALTTSGYSVRLIKINTPATNFLTTAPTATATSITTGGTFIAPFTYSTPTSRGIVYCLSSAGIPIFTGNPNVLYPTVPTGTTDYSLTISGLSSNSIYNIRAFFVSGGIRYYGDMKTKTTGTGATTVTIDDTTLTTAVLSAHVSGSILDSDGFSVIQSGICWSTATIPFASTNPPPSTRTINGSTGVISSPSTCGTGNTGDVLNSNTPYYIRAYAQTSTGYWYSSELSFTTLDGSLTLTVVTPTVYTVVSADSGGEITETNNTTVIERGICWSSSSTTPTVANSRTTLTGATPTIFTGQATGLYGNTIYYIRAYAKNEYGYFYSSTYASVTTRIPSYSIITNTLPTPTLALSITCGGNTIVDDSTYNITDRGFCWGNSINPTVSAGNVAHAATLTGTTSFSMDSSISGNNMIPETGYYIRAYVYNSTANYYAYGAFVGPFTTLSVTPEFVTTQVGVYPTGYTATTITSGGYITTTNGVPVLDKGICWSTSTNLPTKGVSNFQTSGSGNGTLPFAYGSQATNLTVATGYYIRAYITNAYGAFTYYGTNSAVYQTTYTPNILIETVTDTNPFPLSMTCGGNGIVDDAAYPITEKGYCYSSSVNPPTIVNTKVLASPQTGTVSFTANTGNMLTPNVSYYVRAYALNSTTGFVDYGSTVTVLTPNDNATATIPVINNVTQYTADVAYSIGAGTYYTTGTRGICYTIAPIVPTIANGTVFSVLSPPGALAGSFTITLDPLVPFTQYNFKSFITNSAGTVYSPMSTATTLFAPVIKNAYSLRKVVPGYTGSAIRCRNAAGSLANIPFNADGSLNTVALLAHTGVSASSQGTVETWYDQSGTNNMTIAVVSRPCYIVLNGVLQIKNNKPAIFWNAATSAYFRTLTTGSWQVNNLSIFMVSSTTSTAEVQYGLQLGNMIFPRPNTTTDFIKYSASNTAITLGTSSPAIKLDSTLTTSANISAWRNNSSVVTFTGTDTTTATVLYFGSNLGTGYNRFLGTIQELIIYTGNVDGDLNTFTTRNTISSEIMGYYNIT